MTKTTVYLDPIVYRKLKELARRRQQAPAELIRAAVDEYTQAHFQRAWPRSVGMGKSHIDDLARRDEEFLAGMGDTGPAARASSRTTRTPAAARSAAAAVSTGGRPAPGRGARS